MYLQLDDPLIQIQINFRLRLSGALGMLLHDLRCHWFKLSPGCTVIGGEAIPVD